MVPSQTILSLLFIALSTVDASPLIHRDGGKRTLAFSTRLRLDLADGGTLPERERVRVHAMIRATSLSKRSDASVSIANAALDYIAEVGIGQPPNNCVSICYYCEYGKLTSRLITDTLAIDTGSSNTFVGANKTNPYVPTKISVDTGNTIVRAQRCLCDLCQI